MTIVIAGNADSIWIKEYIGNVIDNSKNRVFLISDRNTKYDVWYRNNDIQVLTCRNKLLFGKLYEIFENFYFLYKIKKCDVFHVQYVDMDMLIRTFFLNIQSKNRIITFWGSDLLRASKKKKQFCKLFLNNATHITVMSEAMKKEFISIYGQQYVDRLKVLDFGNSLYNSIAEIEIKLGKGGCKDYWKIPKHKISVAVGYNSIVEQNHINIMEKILELPDAVLNKCYFIFHFGYGDYTVEYRKELEKIMDDRRVSYLFIDKFLEFEEIAILRLCVDILLYGQTTDALAGSVLEYLYAGSILIKPKWLDYVVLQKQGIGMLEYETFDDMKFIFSDVINNNLMICEEEKKHRRHVLNEMNSWVGLKKQWNELYKLEE